MPRFKAYNYDQNAMVVINSWALKWLNADINIIPPEDWLGK
ncbi:MULTISPECIES: hypothetical protein [Halomonadaceae]|nr:MULTISPECIES: hypothetical protein [Halomonas]